MSLTIRERLALQDDRNRRALTQRMLRAGERREAVHDSDVESARSRDSLGGLILAIAFAILCVYAGTLVLDWATDGAVWDIPVPAKIGSVR